MSATSLSKSRQVYLGLRYRITDGAYDATGGLPGEQQLAAEFEVSRVTLRRALAVLESDGLIARRRGAGTFLTRSGKIQPIVSDLSNLMAHLGAMGEATRVKLLECNYVRPPPHIREALRLPHGVKVQKSVRVRFMGDLAFSYLVAFVPERISRSFTSKDLRATPMLTLIERAGGHVVRAGQEISAAAAPPDVARHLHLETGAPLLALTRVAYDAAGEGLEYLRALYHPDRYSFRMDLQTDMSLQITPRAVQSMNTMNDPGISIDPMKSKEKRRRKTIQ